MRNVIYEYEPNYEYAEGKWSLYRMMIVTGFPEPLSISLLQPDLFPMSFAEKTSIAMWWGRIHLNLTYVGF